jgi:hypothetical protein
MVVIELSFPRSSVGMHAVPLQRYETQSVPGGAPTPERGSNVLSLYLYISIVFNRRMKAGLLIAARIFFNLVS